MIRTIKCPHCNRPLTPKFLIQARNSLIRGAGRKPLLAPCQWCEELLGTVARRLHEPRYSMGNQMLALLQCSARGIQPAPIGTFMHWKELGRHVRKGEKALMLCMPVTGKSKRTVTADDGTESSEETAFTRFVFRNNWFVLSQTEGAEYVPEPAGNWDKTATLAALDIAEVPFEHLDGNCQGFAQKRSVAINPLAVMPWKTLFHEIAHVILGHTLESTQNDGSERTPRSLREVEAESVALLCCESLGLAGAEFSRGYIQSWSSEIPERSAQKIFHAADQILKAGVN